MLKTKLSTISPMGLISGVGLLLLLLVGLTSCNGEEEIRTVQITGYDDMSYNTTEIRMAPGETIRIEYTTESDMPPDAMSHNVAIVEPDIDMQSFIEESQIAQDNEYIAPEFEDQVMATTEMLGGGETDVIEFTAPDTPGEIPFVCTFPGHYAGGMEGTIIVER